MEERNQKTIQIQNCLDELNNQLNIYLQYKEKVNQHKNAFDSSKSKSDQLKQLETEYDCKFETYQRSTCIIQKEKEFNQLIKEYQEMIQQHIQYCKATKETSGNELNEILEKIKNIEKEKIDSNLFDMYEEKNYTNYLIQTKEWKRKKEKKKENNKKI